MAVARRGGLVGARWHEHGESVTVTGPLQYTDYGDCLGLSDEFLEELN